jgi:hypothetical membrane protein
VFNSRVVSTTSPTPVRAAAATESRAITFAVGGFVIAALMGLLLLPEVGPISGPRSLGSVGSVVCAALAVLVFVVGFLLSFERPDRAWLRRARLGRQLLDIGALAFAHGAIVLLAWAVFFNVIQQAFFEATLSRFFATVLLGAAAAVTSYVVFLVGAMMNSVRIMYSLCLFLVLGVLTSMLTTGDPYWWEKNLSALGTGDDFSGAAFNLTLIIGGVLVTTLADFVTANLRHSPVVGTTDPEIARARIREVTLSLVLLGIFLAGVGLFPVDDRQLLHILVSLGMVFVYGYLVIRLRWLLPNLTQAFYVVGYVFLAISVVALVLYVVGYWALTAMELIAFVLVFTWLIVFTRTVQAVENDAAATDELAATPRA